MLADRMGSRPFPAVVAAVALLAALGFDPRTAWTQVVNRVSVASDGAEGNDSSSVPVVSPDGRFVVFQSMASNLVPADTNGFIDIFLHDRVTRVTTRVSVASDGMQSDNDSYEPGLSADGRFVTFQSPASNLVLNDTNGSHDAFVHDRVTRQTTRVSLANDGTEADANSFQPAISADGRLVAFQSHANTGPRLLSHAG